MSPNATLTVLPHMRKTPYDPNSFLPVARIGDFVSGFSMHPAVGPKNFKEMVDYAKANPGKLSYGSAGLGTATHLRARDAQVPCRHRHPARALPRQRRRAQRPAAQHRADDERDQQHPAHQGRQAAPAQHQSHLAALGVPGHTDPHRARPTQLRRADLVRDHGPAGTPKEIIDKLNAKCVELAKGEEMQGSCAPSAPRCRCRRRPRSPHTRPRTPSATAS